VAQPNAAHAGRRDQHPALGQFVGHAHLAQRRLLHRQLHDGFLNMLLDPVLDARLATADFLQRQLAAFLVQFLEAIEAVARVAHHLASL
jgi:hypothetical protein